MTYRVPLAVWQEALSTYGHCDGRPGGGIPRPTRKGRYMVYEVPREDWMHLLHAAEAHLNAQAFGADPPHSYRCRRMWRWVVAQIEAAREAQDAQ